MTHPPDPFNPSPSGTDPFGGAPFGQLPGAPPVLTSGPQARPPINTLATLSVAFAFVFAPAGAILGHLGLSQIGRTGQPGRERALIGLVASYAVIAIAVIAIVISASRSSTGTATPRPSSAAARPPTVAPADLATLLPNLQQLKEITGNQGLTDGRSAEQMGASHVDIDRPECNSTMSSGSPYAPNQGAVRGSYESEFRNMTDSPEKIILGLDVIAFVDSAAAQTDKSDVVSHWTRCATGTARIRFPEGDSDTLHFTSPASVGDGITRIEIHLQETPAVGVHAIAAKANIVVDLLETAGTADLGRTLAIMRFVLAKIPS
jgi:hypothetical protein